MPMARLNKLERFLSDDIGLFKDKLGEFSPSLNYTILAEMFALVVGGRKVRKDLLEQYKKALVKYNRTADRASSFLNFD